MRKFYIAFACLVLTLVLVFHHVYASGPTTLTFYQYATYGNNSLLKPTSVYINPNNPSYLFIADTGHNQIDQFTGGTLTILAGNGTAGYTDSTTLSSAEFNAPSAITGIGYVQRSGGYGSIPTYSTDLIVVDTLNNAIRHICKEQIGYMSPPPTCTAVGVTTTAGGTAGFQNGTGSAAEFRNPSAVGNSYTLAGQLVADLGNNAVRSLNTLATTATTSIASTPGLTNGPLSSAQFRGVTSLTSVTGSNPHTLVTDTGNFVIRSIDASNNVTTFAGSGVQGYADGSPSTAQFASPLCAFYNAADGYTYVADALNNVIRRIDSSGNVSTYAGVHNSPGLVNGSNSVAEFSGPTSITIANGFMYVADTGNNAIRRIDMTNLVVSTYIH